MSEYAFVASVDVLPGAETTLFAKKALLDSVDPPVRTVRDVIFYADSAGETFALVILPSGTGTTVAIEGEDLDAESVVVNGKSGWRVKFTSETTFKVVTASPGASGSDEIAGHIAPIKTRVMIKFPPGLGLDLPDQQGLLPDTYEVHYKGIATVQRFSGSLVTTWATGEKHDVVNPPTRTIEWIDYGASRTGDTFTMKVMPGATDGVVNLAGVESTRVVESGKEGRLAVFSNGETKCIVSTEPDAVPRGVTNPQGTDPAPPDDRRIPTTVTIKFPSGGEFS